LKKAGWEDTFTLTILCPTYTALAAALTSIDVTYIIGNTYTLKYISSSYFSLTPACSSVNSNGTFTLTGTPATGLLIFWTSSPSYLYLTTTNYAYVGSTPYTLTARVDNNPSLSASITVNAIVKCSVTAFTISSPTIISPIHILATSLPLSPAANTVIPLPTVTGWTPAACPAVPTIVVKDATTLLVPTWITSGVITTQNVALAGSYSMQAIITIPTAGYVVSSVVAQTIPFTQVMIDCTLIGLINSPVTWSPLYYIGSGAVNKMLPGFTIQTA